MQEKWTNDILFSTFRELLHEQPFARNPIWIEPNWGDKLPQRHQLNGERDDEAVEADIQFIHFRRAKDYNFLIRSMSFFPRESPVLMTGYLAFSCQSCIKSLPGGSNLAFYLIEQLNNLLGVNATCVHTLIQPHGPKNRIQESLIIVKLSIAQAQNSTIQEHMSFVLNL